MSLTNVLLSIIALLLAAIAVNSKSMADDLTWLRNALKRYNNDPL